jgi:hypothetical protein
MAALDVVRSGLALIVARHVRRMLSGEPIRTSVAARTAAPRPADAEAALALRVRREAHVHRTGVVPAARSARIAFRSGNAK